MLSLSNVSVVYGDQIVLDQVDLTVGPNERIGLVGKNGAGKTTLLKIISKIISPHEGQVDLPKDVSVAYLEQELFEEADTLVVDAALRNLTSTEDLQQQLDEITARLEDQSLDHHSPEYLSMVQEMTDLNEKLVARESENLEGKAFRILQGLGFTPEQIRRPLREFSGGWRMRVELARLLLEEPNYLLLDEPTNHLDIEAIIWLEGFLQTYPGSVLVISHDQRFLDAVTTRTVEVERGQLHEYDGSYSHYVTQKVERRKIQEAAQKNQQRIIAHKQRLVDRFRAKASKASMAKSIERQLEKMELIEVDEEDTRTLNLRLTQVPRSGEVVYSCDRLGKSFGQKEVLRNVDFRIIRSEKVAFVGQNGQGKTTLARIIAGNLKPTAGESRLGYNVQLGYFAQNQAEFLSPDKTALEIMEDQATEESRPHIRKILGAFLFQGEDVEKKVSVLSGGEKARLAFAALMLRPFNFLVLDEPTNHLDISSKNVLKQALLEFEGTLIVVSHDREFLSGLTDKTIEFANQQIKTYLGDVEYFLDKRQVADMREAVRTQNPDPARSQTQPGNNDRQKKLQRKVQYLERDISDLEAQKSSYESEMARPEFYDNNQSREVLRAYEELKEKLRKKEEMWEMLIEKLG